MPRKTRMYIPGVPTHVVQRGNNRSATFFCDNDYRYYQQALAEGMRRYGGQLHAYCLMTNHVHLLITPDYPDSISRIMQHIGRLYVGYVNKHYKRSGTLWEGRHRSSLISAEDYLLTSYRYIELNPVTAGMVPRPELYYWSSNRANAWGKDDELVTPHELYLALGRDVVTRHHAYRELFNQALLEEDVQTIRETLNANYPLGNTHFKQQVEAALGIKLGKLKRGGRANVQKASTTTP